MRDVVCRGLLLRSLADWVGRMLLTGCIVWSAADAVAREGTGAPHGTVVLSLESGVAPPSDGQWESRDMDLELTLSDGKWQPDAWAYAVWFNRADHEGDVELIEGDDRAAKLRVALKINRDRWYPSGSGSADYTLDISRKGTQFSGNYTGNFRYPERDSAGAPVTVTNQVRGRVTGRLVPAWHQPLPGFKELQAGEHPRLVFRTSNLPMLKKRAATPEGQEIMNQFFAKLPFHLAGSWAKCKPMFCAGHGFAYQMTGEQKYADQAREYLERAVLPTNEGLSQDIHHGPYTLFTALTFDMCYDAWAPEFRARVIDWLAAKVRDLHSGRNIGTYAPNPWHNHNGVRAPSCGVAAIALLGEKDSTGKEIEGLERIIHIVARDTRRYFDMGLGHTGWCLEGHFYKRMTFNSGPAHFIQAYRTALGGRLIEGWPGGYTLMGEWMQRAPGGKAEAIGGGQDSGLWSVGLATVPEPWRPAARWLFDRDYGLQGNKSFGVRWAYQAAYVLMNYPFDIPAASPDGIMPWVAEDRRKGHWIFRRPWRDGNDFLMVYRLRSEIMSGCHYEMSGTTGRLELWALGRKWVDGVSLLQSDMSNTYLGGKTTHFESTIDGRATWTINFDQYYLEALDRKQLKSDPALANREGVPRVYIPRSPYAHFDHGIRGNRHMAIDVTGACGAPVLIAIVDTIKGGKSRQWRWEWARGVGRAALEGSTLTMGEPTGTHAATTFVLPRDLKRGAGGDAYYLVMTIQKGKAPQPIVKGEGLGATVTVGKRTVSFDGHRLVLGDSQ